MNANNPQAVPESILDKIKKLIALQSGATTEAEAANCAARTQDLLLRYNLDMAQVESHQIKGKNPIIRVDMDLNPYSGKSDSDWVLRLINGLAMTNFCRVVHTQNGSLKGSAAIIGNEVNITVVREMFTYLVGTIKSLATRYWANYMGEEKKNAFKRGFYRGCVMTIRERLEAELEKAKVVDTNVTALVVLSNQLVENKVNEEFPRLTNSKSAKLGAMGGLAHGRMAGNTIGLNKQVNSNSHQNRLN